MSRGATRRGAITITAIALFLLATSACTRQRKVKPRDAVVISVEQQSAWVRNFNPLLPSGPRWPSAGGIYEPMLVFNTMQGRYTPWLATAWGWEEGLDHLRFTLRDGVRWSDGEAFDAGDVVFTFELLRAHPGLDQNGIWRFLKAIRREGERDVVFDFARPFSPGLAYLAHQPIVAEHVFSKIENPLTFANPEPVGTGPFTEVLAFRAQVYELGANPHYWQEGRPRVRALRFPAFPGNDQANLALVGGEVDWAGNFVPAIDRIYVGASPEHHDYWFPLVGSTVFLYANTTRAPFERSEVRRALSRAIDRERVVKVAMYGYTRPADATGLSDAYARWRDAEAVAAGTWVDFDAAAAGRALDAAGLRRGPDGLRRDATGQPLAPQILVVSGWSDWVRAAQVVSRNLREVGIEASVQSYDFSAWFERVQKGDFDLAIGWSVEGPTPYGFYRWLMSPETVKPEGTTSVGNWHRYGSAKGGELLRRFETTADETERAQLADAMQRVFVEEVPAIPLFPNPSWGALNRRFFTGFPTEENPYARLSPNNLPEALLVLTELEAR